MKKNILVGFLVALMFGLTLSANAQMADTIDVITQNKVHMTSPPAGYYGWGVFPADTVSYRKVYLNFTLGCPTGTCSGWDYTVDIYLIQNTHHKDSTLVQGPSFTVNGNKQDSVKTKKDTTYTTFYDTTTHSTDSSANAAYTIVQYKNCAMPTTPTDTVKWWVAGYYNFYFDNTGHKIDSIFISPDTSMYLTYCPYYNVYDSLVTYELARMITPYGSYYNSAWTHPYKFDLTDFSSLLHDSVQIEVFYSGWTDGFLASCDFQMITGIPDHKPYKVTNLWSGSFPYGSTGNPISNYLTKYGAHIDTGAYATRLRILQTGHGEDGNNCTEFCANYQHVYVDGTQRYLQYVWRTDCGLNALMHQSGTWLYDRANWCPGDLVNPYLDNITPYVTRGGTDTLQIVMDPYTTTGGAIYIFGTTLINYGPPSFKLDAAVEDIIAPNMFSPYSRSNPICGEPEVVIRNTGSDTLKSLTFNYGEVGATHSTYTWNGNLPFDDTTLVYLPAVPLKLSPINRFEVTVSSPNGGTDQYANNNYMAVDYDTVPTYPSSFVIRLTTNLVGYQYSYFIEDGNGNKVVQESGFGNSKTYRDTVNLSPGCYHFELDASGEQGLSFFANSNGNGALSFTKLPSGLSFNTFQADFGTSICQNFNVGVLTGIGQLKYGIDYNIYPNPAKDELTIAGLNASRKDKSVKMYSSMGTLVYDHTVGSSIENYTINLSGLAAGIYCVVISNDDGQVVKKIMVTK
ncbi:MAG TPA: peptide-N-glycosidase F-related protein [Bacteroidia bacterium]|nr:peptide-N-glycosidase F-related protein [Bacteroidia bacterium]